MHFIELSKEAKTENCMGFQIRSARRRSYSALSWKLRSPLKRADLEMRLKDTLHATRGATPHANSCSEAAGAHKAAEILLNIGRLHPRHLVLSGAVGAMTEGERVAGS